MSVIPPSPTFGYVPCLEGLVASRQLVEELLVERVAFFPTARGHEDVTADELVNNFTVGGHAAESNIDVSLELDGHLRGGQMLF